MINISKLLSAIILIALIGIIGYQEYRLIVDHKAIAAYVGYRDTVRHYTDKQGNGHAAISVQQVPAEIYNSSKDSVISALRKEVKNTKDLLQYTRMHLQVKDSVIVPVHDTAFVQGRDTVYGKRFTYSDNYLTEQGQIADSTIQLQYSYNMDISVTHAWKRPKWYKAKQLQVDIMTPDPHATIISIQTITIAPQPKKWYETRGFAMAAGIMAGLLIKR